MIKNIGIQENTEKISIKQKEEINTMNDLIHLISKNTY